MNCRKMIGYLASLPLVGLFFGKAKASERTGVVKGAWGSSSLIEADYKKAEASVKLIVYNGELKKSGGALALVAVDVKGLSKFLVSPGHDRFERAFQLKIVDGSIEVVS
jgi:hypothetical protein